jgi:hypothetical protein
MKEKTKYYKATQEHPNDLFDNKVIKSNIKVACLELYSKRPDQKLFLSKEEALADYNTALDQAFEKFKAISIQLKELSTKFDFHISYTMEGDTHGIYEDYQYVCIKVDGYEIMFKYE